MSRNLNNLKSIILESNVFTDISYIGITGSLGRGEKDINDANINDIDFVVIASHCDYTKKYDLDNKLQKITNTNFTDILFLKKEKFISKVKKKNIEQYLFDFIFGNLPLYSTINLDKYKYNQYQIPIISAKDVLFTRLWALIAPFKIENNKLICRDDISFSMYQLHKAYTAIIDAVLIKENLYISPKKNMKIDKFKKSVFYQKHFDCLNLINNYNFKEFDNEVYKKVLYLYYTLSQELIGTKLNYVNFPRKKLLLKSVVDSKSKQYLDNIIIKYNLMIELQKYFNGKKIETEQLNKQNYQIYKEVMK